jgi:O-antigen/teichoic acid export membrane protein
MLAGTGLYGLAILVQRLASFVLIPINTRHLSTADYGVLELIDQISLILAVVLGLNFSSALGYFYHRETSQEGKRRVSVTTLLGAALVGLVAGLICAALADILSRLAYGETSQTAYLRFAFLTLPLTFATEAALGWLRIEDRVHSFVWASVLRVAGTLVATVVFVGLLDLRIWGVLYSTLSALLITVIFLAWYCLPKMRPLSIDFGLFRRMLYYSVPLGLGGVAMFVIHFGDRFLLARSRPLEELGLYSLAYKIAMLLSFAYLSFHNYWSAQIFEIVKREDSRVMFSRVFTYALFGMTFLALALVVMSKPMVRLLTAPIFHGAAEILPLLAGAYFIRFIGDFFRPLFLVMGEPHAENVCNWSGALVCALGYMVWIPKYGIWGAAWSTLVAFAIISLVSLVWTYRLWPYVLELRRLGIIVLVGGVLLGLHMMLGVSGFVPQLASAACLMTLFVGVPLLLGFLTPGEKNLILETWRGFRRRLQES